ncbi:carbohydrate kinase [Methylobacterium durans]|uniref:Gluconokinase n=2 Tax=Methylobacterium durans TaxID=2202825 RepID=A0A2U8WED7_9HYPH|nr:carbohydrate kinase [Methylobacterium durans]
MRALPATSAPSPAPRAPENARPRILVVMGVSGSGKSTVAACLAARLGWAFVDGDSLHTPDHVAKMRAGHPLDDADRAPWLRAVAAWIGARLAAGEAGVVACSALRRAYRDTLVAGRSEVRLVHLDGSRALIAERIAGRHGHFMPAQLLDSQFAALEPPEPEEDAIVVGIADPPDAIAEAVVARLGLGAAATDGGRGA